jgi:hypothetical protein
MGLHTAVSAELSVSGLKLTCHRYEYLEHHHRALQHPQLIENELYEQFGTPEEGELQVYEGEEPLSPSAPRVVYAPIDWSKVPLQYDAAYQAH